VGSIALSPRISPDNSRLAFSAMTGGGWNIAMYSLELGRMVTFPRFGGTNLSPAWSSDGKQIAFSSSRTGDPEIFVCDNDGAHLRRVTAYKGPDVSPVWNPKTSSQIAWVSGRTGLPQIYTMEADGTNPQPGAMIFRRGHRMGGTSYFSRIAPDATRYGPCWPTAHNSTS
jgi:TolB protein